jgi:hypothetical protein
VEAIWGIVAALRWWKARETPDAKL